jgi:3-hydroxyisobutyrate dehydrogenase
MTSTAVAPRVVAFIGLGVMGYPMAGHLAAAGHRVRVYNRSAHRAERWCSEHLGTPASSPAQAAAGADFVMVCVGNDDDVRAVVYGEQGVLAGLSPGAVLIDHTTTSALLAEELAAVCGEGGCAFLDAPVSGGEAGAVAGILSIMVGGETEVFEAALPVMAAYGRRISRLGVAGFGQRAKMVNQVCIAGLLQGLAEGVRLAEATGLNVAEVVDVIKGGAAQSWQLENRAETMAEDRFDFGFAIDWMRKDLAICLQEAERCGLELPVTRLVDGYYGELQHRGLGRCDTSALIRRLGAGDDAEPD